MLLKRNLYCFVSGKKYNARVTKTGKLSNTASVSHKLLGNCLNCLHMALKAAFYWLFLPSVIFLLESWGKKREYLPTKWPLHFVSIIIMFIWIMLPTHSTTLSVNRWTVWWTDRGKYVSSPTRGTKIFQNFDIYWITKCN